jgi:hypothetical protein
MQTQHQWFHLFSSPTLCALASIARKIGCSSAQVFGSSPANGYTPTSFYQISHRQQPGNLNHSFEHHYTFLLPFAPNTIVTNKHC